MVYVNNAGTSWPKPAVVHDAVRETLASPPDRWGERFEQSRATIGRSIGAADVDRLLFTPSCTAALAVALADLPWESGDSVVTSAVEHQALLRPIDALVRHRGVAHRVVPYAPGRPVDLDVLRQILERGRVRLVAMTAASNVTGERLPIAEIATLAHEHGALLLVDAAQLLGVVPFSVAALGADIVTFAGHKGSLGPQGIGALWASEPVRFSSPIARCAIGAGEPCGTFPSYCDVGSVPLASAAGWAAGLAWLDRQPDREAPRRLARRLASAIAERPNCTLMGGVESERTAAVSLRISALPIDRAEEHFRRHDVVVRAGEHCAPSALDALDAPEGTVRISFGPFNTEDDLDAVVRAIDAAVASG